MNSKCDIILTYCWNRVGYTILRTLIEKGLKVCVADTSKKNICSIPKFSENVDLHGACGMDVC